MKIKYALMGISSRFFYSFLIITQLTFGFYSIYENINMYKRVNSETNKVERFFKDKKAYKLEAEEFNFNANSSNFKTIVDIFKTMEKSKKYTFVRNSGSGMMIPTFNNYKQFQASGEFHAVVDGKTYFQTKDMCINRPYIKMYPLNVQKGRMFTDDEFNFIGDNNVFPIIIGANYSKYFKVGDKIPMDSRIGKIVGILKENEYSPGDVSQIGERYVNLNNYIISTDASYKNEVSLCDSTLFNTNYIIFDNSTEQSEINSELSKIKKALNAVPAIRNANMRDLSKYITQDRDMLEEQYEIISITSISVIIFVCITFIISILDSVDKRKKEYGIHIMSGGTLSDIAKITYWEIFITFFISYVITGSIIYYRDGKLININSLILLFIIVLIISLAAAVIPVIKIFKLNINELVKGDE
ncbi:ABC transporter permease [Clostridium fermenticellae]|uniref:ABC transporter permease n=1 Tax=Clostridium fermenticellae TaxID=2068654 RepID=A0A386H2B0_9CLOT|nr:ABC transporter permease [Clostridium fermenticellae]AYD39708.1 ABC transporter permease [Clostridium fermenticellae]